MQRPSDPSVFPKRGRGQGTGLFLFLLRLRMLKSEIQMNPVIVLGEILVPFSPETKRLGRIETVDEEEIGFPREGNVGTTMAG